MININNNKFDIKKGIYIPNIEACWLYKYNEEHDNYKVNDDHLVKLLNGKLDYSLELLLNEELINNIEIRQLEDGKLYTLDVVNVKFTKKYKKRKKEKNTKELRDWTYENGFMFNNKLISNWKRSSGKARVGQNLFILDIIRDSCLEWARMGLTFKGLVDIGSIRAYESLPLSSIIGTVKINPNNILVIDDFESKFPWTMSKTWLENGKLKTKTTEVIECNSIWDGQGLLSNKIFDNNEIIKGKGVALLRNRYMKCAGFCCYIEKFFLDYCKKNNLDYETYEVSDMYGNKIKVKDIILITTPSAIKLNKYNDDKTIKESGYEGKGAWLQYWKNNCGDIFGICKTEKHSHHCIENKEGNIVTHRNVLSYQMVNTIPFTKDELKKLVKPEIEYIERLKNDLNFFLKEVNQLKDGESEKKYFDKGENNIKVGNDMDVIQAFVELSKMNPNFANTQVFKDYRRNFINAYINNLRKGKIKINGADYCVACGNPYEMLMATVGEFKGESFTLKNNELYCSMFDNNENIVGFRNPSVNVGNIGVQVNKFYEEINTYMNDTPNIVYLNSIKYPILSTYQGEDFDIDSNLLTNNSIIVSACNRIDKDVTAIPVNAVENTGKNNRKLTAKNMSDVDHIISQNHIGSTINLSQELNSSMNHAKYNNLLDQYQLDKIYDMTSKLSSISCCEIDKAKKQFEDLNVPYELDKMKLNMELVDSTIITNTKNYIKELQKCLKDKQKEIIKYRSIERKQYNKQKRNIKNILRIHNNKKLTNDEINNINNKIKNLNNEILIANEAENKQIKKEIRKLKKILKEDSIEKLSEKKVSKLLEDLDIINTIIYYINIERQEEIDILKHNLSKKYSELRKYDSRRIKPYFFKFIGDNNAKKQRKITYRKHKKYLDNKTIIKFAKDNNLSINEIDLKNKQLLKQLTLNKKVQKKWKDSIYRKLDTPMDWLQEELDKIKNNKKSKTIQVIQLIKVNTNKIDNDIVNSIVLKIQDLNAKIKSYKLNNDLSYKDRIENIKNAKEEVVKAIIDIKPTKSDLYGIMKKCLNSVKKNGKINKKSYIESIALEILFMAFGDGLLNMFKK